MEMEFNEQPLTYPEAFAEVLKFEKLYKINSQDFFDSLDNGTPSVEVHPDDIYEWRSYFAFKSELDSRLNRMLGDSAEPIQEIVYSASVDIQPQMKAQNAANNNLASWASGSLDCDIRQAR
jgi:hypothetical protein